MASPLDGSVLARLAEDVGGRDAVEEIVDVFLADLDRMTGELDGRDAEGDRSFVRAVHTLKSSSAILGAQPLSDLCQRAETLARAGDLGGARRLLPPVKEELARVADALRAWRKAR